MTSEDITLSEKEGIRRNSIASVSSLEKGKKEEEFLWKEGLVPSGDRVFEEALLQWGCSHCHSIIHFKWLRQSMLYVYVTIILVFISYIYIFETGSCYVAHEC